MNEIAEAFQRVLAHVMRTRKKSGPYYKDVIGGYWDRDLMEKDQAILSRLIDMKTPWADTPEQLGDHYTPP